MGNGAEKVAGIRIPEADHDSRPVVDGHRDLRGGTYREQSDGRRDVPGRRLLHPAHREDAIGILVPKTDVREDLVSEDPPHAPLRSLPLSGHPRFEFFGKGPFRVTFKIEVSCALVLAVRPENSLEGGG